MKASDFDDVLWNNLIMQDDFELIAWELYKQHTGIKELDYTYIKNISIDADYFLNLPTETKKLYLPTEYGKFIKTYSDAFTDAYIHSTLEKADPDNNSEAMKKLKQELNLDEIYCVLQTQLPGSVVGEHIDRHRQLAQIIDEKGISGKVKRKHIRKYIVMLDDWASGQAFLCGRHAYMNWRKGDVFTFPWYMPHSTANTGLKPRPLLFICGVEWNHNMLFS